MLRGDAPRFAPDHPLSPAARLKNRT